MDTATNDANDVSEHVEKAAHRPYRSKLQLVAAHLPQVRYAEMESLAALLLDTCPAAAMHMATELQRASGAVLLRKLQKGYKYRVLTPDGDLTPVRKFK